MVTTSIYINEYKGVNFSVSTHKMRSQNLLSSNSVTIKFQNSVWGTRTSISFGDKFYNSGLVLMKWPFITSKFQQNWQISLNYELIFHCVSKWLMCNLKWMGMETTHFTLLYSNLTCVLLSFAIKFISSAIYSSMCSVVWQILYWICTNTKTW